ncbi:hypothetical protein KIF24_11050 [Micromonospora sp. Llam7]|uniref:hypothetical protein n=1 Tax=Micromonospora tarapacensis TaxID=2835305 RepID=UPI001C83DE02|nr:hypothetical protein [Micromonospora tarapacensis]MBX7266517.1 hypothetical protein [Micromonospora tarapacensis]
MPTPTPMGEVRTPQAEARRAGRAGGPLRLVRPTVRIFGRRCRPEPTAQELEFLTDFLAEFGMEVDLERYAGGGGNSFTDMCAELLDGLDGALPPLETVLLAFHVPDLRVIEVAGSYLAGRCSGDPAVFSVAGQGVGAPFTALRILDCMRPAGDAAGAVLVLDQSTVPHPDPDPEGGPVRDCAVLLCTDPVDAAGPADAVTLDFLDERCVADPADLADALATGPPPPGSWRARHSPADSIHAPAPGTTSSRVRPGTCAPAPGQRSPPTGRATGTPSSPTTTRTPGDSSRPAFAPGPRHDRRRPDRLPGPRPRPRAGRGAGRRTRRARSGDRGAAAARRAPGGRPSRRRPGAAPSARGPGRSGRRPVPRAHRR